MQETQTVEVTEPQTEPIAVSAEEVPTKLSSFLLWRTTPSRFLPARSRSQSDHKSSPHPLQTTLQPSNSTPDLKAMAVTGVGSAKSADSAATQAKSPAADTQLLQTPSDPKTPSSSSTISRNDSVLDPNNPTEIHDEVSKLNEKLINAINHQASLDETLQQTRNELDVARKLIARLENEAKEARQKAEETSARMAAELEAEKESRTKAETEKKDMESELESLTSALFIEANTMVSDARKEKEVSDKKIEQLRAQLQESDNLVQSHQDQLTDLKTVLERMRSDEMDAAAQVLSVPSSPLMPSFDHTARDTVASGQPGRAAACDISPDQPLSFSHMLKPVLRTDHHAYNDFASLMKQAITTSPPSSRNASGNYSNLAVAASSPPAATQTPTPSIGAFPSMGLVGTSVSPRTPSSPVQPIVLRETKVYKKALAEDIEPALRLDVAPGISWMVRRPIVTSMIDGTLVVEPMPPSPVKGRGPVNQCSLCGENRVGELYTRKHRFRISEDAESKRFPLCDLCLGRLRSCCELLSFLRTVAGGHWRADSEDEVKSAWEEYVKLRERIFWHRMAGGVVPVGYVTKDSALNSARPSLDSSPPEANAEQGVAVADAASPEKQAEPTPSGDSEAFETPAATPQPVDVKDPITIQVQDASQQLP